MVWALSLLTTNLSTRRLTPVIYYTGILSLIEVGNLVRPLTLSVLYLRHTFTRLYLNIFRGEPAITGFDWPFTPIHKSSKPFSAGIGSVLHTVLPVLQPAHG